MRLKRKSFLAASIALILYLANGGFESLAHSQEVKDEDNFVDVSQSHWAYKEIIEMKNDGIIIGYPNGEFKPNKTITRAEFSKIIILASGINFESNLYQSNDKESTFYDVNKSHWAKDYIEESKYYFNGFKTPDGKLYYSPNTKALREDIAIAIVKIKGYENRSFKTDVADIYTDSYSISKNARKYISIAWENNLMKGFPDNSFKSQSPITRAEVAVLLSSMRNFGNDNKEIIEFEKHSKESNSYQKVKPEEITAQNKVLKKEELNQIKKAEPQKKQEIKNLKLVSSHPFKDSYNRPRDYYPIIYHNDKLYELQRKGVSKELSLYHWSDWFIQKYDFSGLYSESEIQIGKNQIIEVKDETGTFLNQLTDNRGLAIVSHNNKIYYLAINGDLKRFFLYEVNESNGSVSQVVYSSVAEVKLNQLSYQEIGSYVIDNKIIVFSDRPNLYLIIDLNEGTIVISNKITHSTDKSPALRDRVTKIAKIDGKYYQAVNEKIYEVTIVNNVEVKKQVASFSQFGGPKNFLESVIWVQDEKFYASSKGVIYQLHLDGTVTMLFYYKPEANNGYEFSILQNGDIIVTTLISNNLYSPGL